MTDTVLSSVSFVNLVQPSFNEPDILPFPRREIERLDVLACRAFRRELRKVIIRRNGGHLPTPPRYVSPRERRSRRPPPQPPLTGSSPPSPPPADNPAPSTSRATGGSLRGSTSTAPSASTFSPSGDSSFSPGMSSTYHYNLLTDSEIDTGIGGGYDDPDELDGVRPFTYPNSPHRSRPFPSHLPSEVPQPQSTDVPVTPGVGILGGDTIDVDMMGSSNTTAFEQVHFIEMISRHFLYCHIPHFRNHTPRGLNSEEEGDKEEDASQSNSDSSFDSDRASYGDSDQMNSDEEEEDREAGEGHTVEGKGGDGEHQSSDLPPRIQSTSHSSQRSQRTKRRKREGITEESTGHDSSNEHDSGTRRKEAKRKVVHRSRNKRDQSKVWRKQSYLFQEEMRLLLEEMRSEMRFSSYAGELVLKIN